MATNNLSKKTHLDLKYCDLTVSPADSPSPASRLQHQIIIPKTVKAHKKDRKYDEKSMITNKTVIPNDTTVDITASVLHDNRIKDKDDDSEYQCQKYLNQQEIKYLLMDTKSIWNGSHQKYEEKRARLHQHDHMVDKNKRSDYERSKYQTLSKEITKFEKAVKCISQHNQCIHRKIKLLHRRNQCYLDQLEIVKIRDKYKKISGFKIKDTNSGSAHISPYSPGTPDSHLKDTKLSILNSTAMAQLSKYIIEIEDEASQIQIQTNDFIQPQDKTRKTLLKNVENWKLDPPRKSHNSLKASKVVDQRWQRDKKNRLKENDNKIVNFYEGLYQKIQFPKPNNQSNINQSFKGAIRSMRRDSPRLEDKQKIVQNNQNKVKNLKKTIIKNNIDKKISQCLKRHNMRVPGFIKSIR